MNKKLTEKAEKAALRYSKKFSSDSQFIIKDAFIKGIEWYLKNKNKIEEEESMDFYYRLSNYRKSNKIFLC